MPQSDTTTWSVKQHIVPTLQQGDYESVVPSPSFLPKETAASEPDEFAAWLETEERFWIPPCTVLTRDAHVAIGLREVDPKPVRLIRDTRYVNFVTDIGLREIYRARRDSIGAEPLHGLLGDWKDPVIEKRDLPLSHGSKYSSDSEGDGPSLETTTFFEAWPFISSWIKQHRRKRNLQLAEAWGREYDEQLLIKPFARLYNWRKRGESIPRLGRLASR